MELGDLILHYGAEIAMWADALTKTDLMVLLGAFLLGQYMGSKRNVHTRKAADRNTPV